MAITPEDLGKLTKKESRLVDRIERELDRSLKEGDLSDGYISREIPEELDVRSRVYDELASRYIRAGWEIGVETSRYGWTGLFFTPKNL